MRARAAIAAIALVSLLPLVNADINEEAIATINPDEFWQYTVEIYEENGGVEQAVPVTVTTTLTDGPAINFFVLDEDNFARYQRGEPFAGISGERTFGIVDEYTTTIGLYDVGLYYLIWDNFDYDDQSEVDQASQIRYTVSSEDVVQETIPAPSFLTVTALLVSVGLVTRLFRTQH